jgi:hypothetical protein
VAECAGLVPIHRELLIVEHQLADQLQLLDLIVRRRRQARQRLRLDAIDFGFDLVDLLQSRRRERGRLVRARRVGSRRGGAKEECEAQAGQPRQVVPPRARFCRHFGPGPRM